MASDYAPDHVTSGTSSHTEDTGAWMEPIAPKHRYFRAALAVALTCAVAGWIAWAQWSSHTLGDAESLWIVVILTAGGWWARGLLALREIRRFETTTRDLSKAERVRMVLPLVATAVGTPALMWVVGQSSSEPTIDWLWAGAISGPLLAAAAAIYLLRRKETALTMDGQKAKHQFDALEAERAKQRSVAVDNFLNRPVVRYPAALGLFWLAYYLTQIPQHKSNDWILPVAAAGWAMWLARELFGPLIGAILIGGLAWALFTGIAAVPVSVAVIVGALIIANAIKR